MAKKRAKGKAKPAEKKGKMKLGGEVLRDAKEFAKVEQYYNIEGPPKRRKPPKDYDYGGELVQLQFELIKLQEWVRLQGLRVCVLFEARDAAGLRGVITPRL